jgi:Domain of unknown function (DUF6894)
MPMYLFHLTDGNTLLADDQGMELPDAQAARAEAEAVASELADPQTGLSQDLAACSDASPGSWFVCVVNSTTGLEVAHVRLSQAWRMLDEVSPTVRHLDSAISQTRRHTGELIAQTRRLTEQLADTHRSLKRRLTDARAVAARSQAQSAGNDRPTLSVIPGGRAAEDASQPGKPPSPRRSGR